MQVRGVATFIHVREVVNGSCKQLPGAPEEGLEPPLTRVWRPVLYQLSYPHMVVTGEPKKPPPFGSGSSTVFRPPDDGLVLSRGRLLDPVHAGATDARCGWVPGA